MRLVNSLNIRSWALLGAVALAVALPGVTATLGDSAKAGTALEERKSPMHFNWIACGPNCHGWISAVGIITQDSPKDFDNFARGRDLTGATVVLDSSGGSVNDAIALGRRWRNLGLLTTVGTSELYHTAGGDRGTVNPDAYCRSRCACSYCSLARHVTSLTARMSGCIRSGWAIAPMTPKRRAIRRRT